MLQKCTIKSGEWWFHSDIIFLCDYLLNLFMIMHKS